jgi:hypothetical protein
MLTSIRDSKRHFHKWIDGWSIRPVVELGGVKQKFVSPHSKIYRRDDVGYSAI